MLELGQVGMGFGNTWVAPTSFHAAMACSLEHDKIPTDTELDRESSST